VTDARKIYHGECFGGQYSAIQITTAGSLCAVLDLHTQGRLPTKGFLRQEQVPLDEFLANRFGKCYACDTPDVPVRNGGGNASRTDTDGNDAEHANHREAKEQAVARGKNGRRGKRA